jgi:hypothetical protein
MNTWIITEQDGKVIDMKLVEAMANEASYSLQKPLAVRFVKLEKGEINWKDIENLIKNAYGVDADKSVNIEGLIKNILAIYNKEIKGKGLTATQIEAKLQTLFETSSFKV